jgi:DNA repair protein REV1
MIVDLRVTSIVSFCSYLDMLFVWLNSFSNSRLSYIGSFKQRVKSTEMATSRKPKAGSKRFVLLVDMDCFFASVALKNFPEYKNCPVAVGHSPTVELKYTNANQNKATSPPKALHNSSSELSTCNYIARQYGVKKGMFLGDATKVIRSFLCFVFTSLCCA